MKKLFGILIALLALTGCGKDGSTTTTNTTTETENTAPYVVSTSPSDFAGGVLLGADISATFSEPMNEGTIALVVSDGTNTVAGTTAYGGKTALFSPGADLSPNTDYTVTIAAGALDLEGEAMSNAYSWKFTTGASAVDPATAPSVVSTSPSDFAEGVSVSTDISATFSESMNDATIAIVVSDGTNTVNGTMVYGGKTALFTPGSELLPNTTYTVMVASAAADLDGNAMRADYSWQFTTCDVPPWVGIKQFGTSADDQGMSVAVSGTGDIYVTGYTKGSLDGTNAGGWDVFLAKYDSRGVQQWIRQFGSSADDSAYSVAVSGSDVYVTGVTMGSLDGTNQGVNDVFLAKYDSSGGQQWIRQFGTGGNDVGFSVAVNGSDVYVTGATRGSLGSANQGGEDVFFAKYDSSGAQQTIVQYGTSVDEEGRSVVLSSTGDIYVAWIQTSGGIWGMRLRKYDSSLNFASETSVGSAYHLIIYSAAGNGNGDVYVAGSYNDGGSVHGAFIAKFGSTSFAGPQYINSADYDQGTSIAVSGSGDVYLAGQTAGSLWGTNQGYSDVFLGKYNSNLVPTWQRQFGTAGGDIAPWNSVAVSGAGDVFVVGLTYGDMGGSTAGSSDVFVAKYDSSGNLQ